MEHFILSWISSHLSWIATWVVGIGGVSLAIKKYGPKIRKFVKIGREAMDIIDTLLDAVQDDKITDDEIKKIVEEVQQFKNSLK